MTDNVEVDQDSLDLAKKFVEQLEQGNQQEADNLLTELTNLRETELFQELGKLTREFHEAINGFNSDDRMSAIAQDDIPDARERLKYVIEKTDEAAHKTLNAIEEVTPIVETIESQVSQLGVEWERFLKKEMNPQEFRDLSQKIKEYFFSTEENLKIIKTNVNDILMAQDFQDITGQIIKRVITLVGEVEKNLVNLVKLGGGVPTSESEDVTISKKVKTSTPGELEGPQIPGMESDEAVSSQNDVDELLSSLGF